MVSERAAFTGNRRDHFPRHGRLARKESWDVDHSQGSCMRKEHKCDKDKERKASPRKKET